MKFCMIKELTTQHDVERRIKPVHQKSQKVKKPKHSAKRPQKQCKCNAIPTRLFIRVRKSLIESLLFHDRITQLFQSGLRFVAGLYQPIWYSLSLTNKGVDEILYSCNLSKIFLWTPRPPLLERRMIIFISLG